MRIRAWLKRHQVQEELLDHDFIEDRKDLAAEFDDDGEPVDWQEEG